MQLITTIIEGTWELEEWHVGGQIFRPPHARGRFSLHDNTIIFLLYRQVEDTAHSFYGYGNYVLNDTTWGYRYDHEVAITETLAGTTISHLPPWPDIRYFQIINQPHQLVLDNENGRRQIIFAENVLMSVEEGQLQRKWQRVISDKIQELSS